MSKARPAFNARTMLRLKRGRELLDVFRVQGAPEALLSL